MNVKGWLLEKGRQFLEERHGSSSTLYDVDLRPLDDKSVIFPNVKRSAYVLSGRRRDDGEDFFKYFVKIAGPTEVDLQEVLAKRIPGSVPRYWISSRCTAVSGERILSIVILTPGGKSTRKCPQKKKFRALWRRPRCIKISGCCIAAPPSLRQLLPAAGTSPWTAYRPYCSTVF